MDAHMRNDVEQSAGLVVPSDWQEWVDVSLISHSVEACIILSIDKPSFGDTEKALIFV
jgi:hypothetical protein